MVSLFFFFLYDYRYAVIYFSSEFHVNIKRDDNNKSLKVVIIFTASVCIFKTCIYVYFKVNDTQTKCIHHLRRV